MKFIRKFLKYLMLLFIILIAGGAIAWLIAPTGPRELLEFDDPYHKKRKAVSAKQYMASTGTPWATQAAVDVLENGGNAFDAAAAALLVLNVTYGEAASFPGVAPLLIYDAKTNTIKGYVGAGTAPEKATIELFKSKGHKTVPKNDMWAQLLPASPDVLISLLKDYGTKSFSELSRPAARIAKEGFPVHKTMLKNLDLNLVERFGFNLLMPYNVDIYLSGQWWRPLHHKERFVRPHLSQTFLDMAQAEKDILRRENSRSRGLTAVRDYFYKGPIADKIVDMHSKENGLFSKKDLANYKGYWEKPVSGSFKEYTIFANNTWCQGPVVPMVLQLLEGIDLKSLGHNSPEYLHTLIQAIELAMADREAFFGDPEFVKVPIKGLLDPGYAAERRKQLTPGKAFGKMPAHGSPSGFQAMNQHIKGYAFNPVSHKNNQLKIGRDTSYICIVDSAGNAVSLTPSDFPQTPMVPGTGLTLGNRMTQFRLDPKHPTALMPGKRPRISPNPGMVLKNGKFFMTFGTPGDDMQPQAMIQVFLNITVFGMDPQEAIDAPRFRSFNFPASFAPHQYRPGVVEVEKSIYNSAGDKLKKMGYSIVAMEKWDNRFGAVCAIIKDQTSGNLIGGADPREESWAGGR